MARWVCPVAWLVTSKTAFKVPSTLVTPTISTAQPTQFACPVRSTVEAGACADAAEGIMSAAPRNAATTRMESLARMIFPSLTLVVERARTSANVCAAGRLRSREALSQLSDRLRKRLSQGTGPLARAFVEPRPPRPRTTWVGSTFKGSTGSNAILALSSGTHHLDVTIEGNSLFQTLDGAALTFGAGNSAGATGSGDLIVRNSSFLNAKPGGQNDISARNLEGSSRTLTTRVSSSA